MADQAQDDEAHARVTEVHADGGSRHDKFQRDPRLLGAGLERDLAHTRTVFHLAQTMRDLGEREKAIALYECRAQMGAGAKRCFHAHWFQNYGRRDG
ncbi:hypothetical protein [Streptomyces atratus]|uniref:hypothetical protein n=1 Tax=Streptomyces atratus TaxID=1893 RepID=UPI0033EAB043